MYKGASTITQIILNKEETMPKTKNSKAKTKKSKQRIYSKLTEIIQCNVIDCNIVNGFSMLFYNKEADKTLNCCWVHPSVNPSIISEIKEKIFSLRFGKGFPSYWIAKWNCLDGLYIRNIAPSFEDLIQEVDTMKLMEEKNAMNPVSKIIIAGEKRPITKGGKGGLVDDDIPF